MIVVEGGSRAAAPKGSMTYAFTRGNFLLLPNLHAHIPALRPKSSLEAQMSAERPKCQLLEGEGEGEGGEGGGGENSPYV